MEILQCPKCGQRGFLTLRYTKYKDLRYLYVGHYNFNKKSKRSWCSIRNEQIKNLKMDKFWQYEYYRLIKETVNLRENTNEIKIWIKPLEIATKLLRKNGYSKILIESKLIRDLMNEEKNKIHRMRYPLQISNKDGKIGIKQRYMQLRSKLLK